MFVASNDIEADSDTEREISTEVRGDSGNNGSGIDGAHGDGMIETRPADGNGTHSSGDVSPLIVCDGSKSAKEGKMAPSALFGSCTLFSSELVGTSSDIEEGSDTEREMSIEIPGFGRGTF